MCSGFGPARDTCTFPESDPVWSSCMGSGSGLARASCAFPGSDPAASDSLSVRSESVVDEDSWTTFYDVSSSDRSVNKLLVLRL
ncbi:hypothetical protein Tco_0463771, partial [Tanacetum coccineum]